MTDDDLIRPIRSVAAWVMVTFTALLEALFIYDWLDRASEIGAMNASVIVNFSSVYIVGLPILAVVLTGTAKPPTPGAPRIAVIAFTEYGIALLFTVLTFCAYALASLSLIPATRGDFAYVTDRGNLSAMVYSGGTIALISVAAFAVWRIISSMATVPTEDDYYDDEEEPSPL